MSSANYNSFTNAVTVSESNYIKKLQAGFALGNFCDMIKDMYANVCIHFLQNSEVFDDERKNAVNRIINYLSNG